MSTTSASAVSLSSSPVAFLHARVPIDAELAATLDRYERRWSEWGQSVSDAVDRLGTPHVRMFDALGTRLDEIQYPPDYYELLREGYRAGVVWRAMSSGTLVPSFLLGYVTAYFDPGLYCPYTVSLSTACPLSKYGTPELKARFLDPLLRRDDAVWQGATWMTEVAGGSDLGTGVETLARKEADGTWRLSGDKYFCSNANADVAVVAARPVGAPPGVRGVALFLVPRLRVDGRHNYALRRLKDKIGTRSVPTGEIELRDSDGYYLGDVHLVLEVLNISRVANSVASVAIAQRAIDDAVAFAERRVAFGRPVADHPLLATQIATRRRQLEECWALAYAAVRMLDEVWRETPPYSERHWTFRLLTHLAKFWTAEVAVQTAKWAMEVLAGVGTLAENRTERWLREAMICAIWEGTPHRQMLDALETMERKRTHQALLATLADRADAREISQWRVRLDDHVARPVQEREGGLEPVFRELAAFVARAFAASNAR